MTVLVLGGTGAMGIPLVQQLSQECEVYVTSRKKRISNNANVHYLQGNAHNNSFLIDVLKKEYDVIIDFISWSRGEFQEKIDVLLNSCGQYIFTSSCRVYAQSTECITEETPRLLDVCDEKKYLDSEEYALTKAREENLILSSCNTNWTIIRPGITYNTKRLQLGLYEMDFWLGRALRGQTILISEDILKTITPMTYGNDVANAITHLTGNQEAFGQIVQIATAETMSWSEILKIYSDTLLLCGIPKPKIFTIPKADYIAQITGNQWRLKYNRIYDRTFDCSKLDTLCKRKMPFMPMRQGLQKCLREYINTYEGQMLISTSMRLEAYADKLAGERTPSACFKNTTDKIKYFVARSMPAPRI